jgi:hypothetical protein
MEAKQLIGKRAVSHKNNCQFEILEVSQSFNTVMLKYNYGFIQLPDVNIGLLLSGETVNCTDCHYDCSEPTTIQLIEQPYTRFRADRENSYKFINAMGNIGNSTEYKWYMDNFRHSIGNQHPNDEYAQLYKDELILMQELTDKANQDNNRTKDNYYTVFSIWAEGYTKNFYGVDGDANWVKIEALINKRKQLDNE